MEWLSSNQCNSIHEVSFAQYETLDTVHAISSLAFASTRRIAENFQHDFLKSTALAAIFQANHFNMVCCDIDQLPWACARWDFFYFSLPPCHQDLLSVSVFS